MILKTALRLSVIAALAAALGGCFEEAPAKPAALPEVNDENCKAENIATITDEGARQKFSSACLRRGGFEKSPERNW